jgi:hypothetical protein
MNLPNAEPLDNHGWEWRCYMRDPDGYLIDVGHCTQKAFAEAAEFQIGHVAQALAEFFGAF